MELVFARIRQVYMLNSDRAWDDKGTGHVSCAYVERFQGMALIVRSEDDDSKLFYVFLDL